MVGLTTLFGFIAAFRLQIKEFDPESAETSSENVSQYLDKEEVCPKVADVKPKQTTPVPEPADRKRKLSSESGHSFMKRIQDAKRKIKVPKISFSTKKVMFNKLYFDMTCVHINLKTQNSIYHTLSLAFGGLNI